MNPILLFAGPYEYALSFLHSGWFFFAILLVCSIATIVYNQLRKGYIRNQKSETERVLAEKEEILQYALANEQRVRESVTIIDNSKKELLAKISHEIRTPMNVVLGMASLLNETPLNNEQQEYVSALIKSGDGLLKVINDILLNDILQYSKIDSGKELESKHLNLRSTIEEVLEMFTPKATQSKLDLLYSIDPNIPPLIVSDAMRLRQILMNLVENAFRFTSKGEIVIRVNIAERNINGLMLEFEVSDTGAGMSYEKLKEVSMDLIQPSSEVNASCIGITLTICKKLVNLMGGIIEVDSTENEGSVFRFTIYTGKSDASLQKQKDTTSFQGKKALIVDDNFASLQLLKRQLEAWKMEVHVARCGEEALSAFSATTGFHVVITDEHMPGMSGIELATAIRKNQPTLPLMLLQSNEESKEKYARLFESFIAKPLKQQPLADALSSLFHISHTTQKYAETCMSADFAARHPLSILIAEDDAMNQQMLKMVLKKLGYDSTIAANGKEVLEIVSHTFYDVILMDVQMPEMDGLEASRMIRLCLDNQPVIIAMTANTQQGDREKCLEAGMNDYLSKPVNLPDLMRVLERWAKQEQEKSKISMRA